MVVFQGQFYRDTVMIGTHGRRNNFPTSGTQNAEDFEIRNAGGRRKTVRNSAKSSYFLIFFRKSFNQKVFQRNNTLLESKAEHFFFKVRSILEDRRLKELEHPSH